MTVRNKKFRRAMEEAGLGKIELAKQNGEMYFYSDDDMMSEILGMCYTTSVTCFAFDHMPIDKWVREANKLYKEGLELFNDYTL